ncbi:2361_t:CDS:1 [Dentiscutata heterogama]|uniref:2361_t:CDS:1 n=1 Tax=Dentiscutata heterogama TaxID=1316150 RepID=A0ACA9ND60_9GLOM|nr:2361_t:CDS:1 [Dentiscutata heterogama]
MKEDNKKIEKESETQEIYRDNEMLLEKNKKIIISKDLKSLKDNPDLETKMSVFDDVLYTDNKNRLKRANELQNDIKTYMVELAKKKDKLDSILKNLKEKLDHISEQLDISKIPYIKKEVYEDSTLLLSTKIEFISDFIIF